MEQRKNKSFGTGYIIVCSIITIFIFILQLISPLTLNTTILYTSVVLLTVFIPGMRYTLVFTLIATSLIIGVFIYHLPEIFGQQLFKIVLPNRIFGLAGLWMAFYIIKEVKKASSTASLSTERMNALFEHATEGIIITNSKGEIVQVNPEAEKHFGYVKDELIGQRIEVLIPTRFTGKHVEHRTGYYKAPHSRYMGAGMDLYARRKDGSEFPVEISLSTFHTSEGMFVVSFIINITERKKQEEAVKQEKERAQLYLEVAPVIFIVVTKEGKVSLINSAGAKIFGYSEKEIIGKNWMNDLVPKDARPISEKILKEIYEKNIDTVQEYENFIITGTGEKRIILWKIVAIKNKAGIIVATLRSGEDITLRKAQEQAIRREKETAQRYLDLAPVIFLVVNKEGTIDLINNSGCRILGYEEREILGKNWIENFIPEESKEMSKKTFAEIFKSNTIPAEGYENYVVTRRGVTRLIAWKIRGLRDINGNIIATLNAGEDITEKRIQEEALRKAHEEMKDFSTRLQESNAELEQFAYISSHDLQEPLRKIQSFGDRLLQKESPKLSDQGKDYIDRMLNAASRMQNLINDLLAFSRVTSKARPFEKVDLNLVLQGVLSDLEVSIEKAQAKVEVLTQMPIIDADPTQMRQVFQNLISNAIKFRKDNEPPLIKIYSKVAPTDGKMIEIFVEDNGIGFDEKYTDRIFNIFQRLEGQKYEGSGIGLAICKKIAVRHGGDITAKSEPGKGSLFIVKLALNHI